MPVPFVAYALFQVVATAITVYEAYSALEEVFDAVDDFAEDLDKAKKELDKIFKSIKEEIDDNIEGRDEVAVLEALSLADDRPLTVSGRMGSGKQEIKAAIKQKIPFRRVISEVCEKADSMPVLTVRRKDKGISLEKAVKAKSEIIKKLIGAGFEALADIELEEFIIVRQKQLAASFLFEFIDYGLDWKSPLKAEVSFGPGGRSKRARGSFEPFKDPPMEFGTKLKRVGYDLNPFYPAPHRAKGSISADLIIPEYRKEPVGKKNLFAIVEIKFPKDKIKTKQIINYHRLLNASKDVKDKLSLNKFNDNAVNSGGRIALFRFPEDRSGADEKAGGNDNRSRSNSKKSK